MEDDTVFIESSGVRWLLTPEQTDFLRSKRHGLSYADLQPTSQLLDGLIAQYDHPGEAPQFTLYPDPADDHPV